MKHFSTRFALALIVLAAGAGIALAADSPFAGTWKLNLEKSKFTGYTFTYATTATGFHYSDGGPVAFDFAIDGKDYPVIDDRTSSWTKNGDNSWNTVSKDGKGTVLSKGTMTLSADGKTLKGTYTDYRPDGSTSNGSDVYTRVSGGPGLAGTWKNVKVNTVSDSFSITVPATGQYKIEYPDYKITVEGTADGTPATVKGPTIPDGYVASYKPTGADKWEYSYTLKDKLLTKGFLVVSDGGKKLTDTSWKVGKESEKSIAVYDKQ